MSKAIVSSCSTAFVAAVVSRVVVSVTIARVSLVGIIVTCDLLALHPAVAVRVVASVAARSAFVARILINFVFMVFVPSGLFLTSFV